MSWGRLRLFGSITALLLLRLVHSDLLAAVLGQGCFSSVRVLVTQTSFFWGSSLGLVDLFSTLLSLGRVAYECQECRVPTCLGFYTLVVMPFLLVPLISCIFTFD